MGTDKSKTRGLAGLCVGKRAGRELVHSQLFSN